MKISEKDFVFTVQNNNSPVLITVPHGGMKNASGSWLDFHFKKRTKSLIEAENYISGEKISLGGDGQIMHIVGDIMKESKINVVAGLLPREFVDYNRFVPEVAYADRAIKRYYDAYHAAIARAIQGIQSKGNPVVLLDFHGFGKQPIEGRKFDIVLGTNGESSPFGVDKLFYDLLKEKYEIFSAGRDGLPDESDMYRGDTTNLYYHRKYGIDSMLIEIAPRFRSKTEPGSKESGQELAKDISMFLTEIGTIL